MLSHAIRQSLGKIPTPAERPAAAFDAAQSLDDSLQLPVDDTVVNLREAPRSSQSEQFKHTNDKSWENLVLQRAGLTTQIHLALRCLLDAFYKECGYVSVWDQNQTQHQHQNQASQQFLTRSHAVEQSMSVLKEFGIERRHVTYLVGRYSFYRENHEYMHDIPVSAVGAAMAKICRQSQVEERVESYMLVWTFLTGHKSWRDAENDDRWIGSSGVTRYESWLDENSPHEFDIEAVGFSER